MSQAEQDANKAKVRKDNAIQAKVKRKTHNHAKLHDPKSQNSRQEMKRKRKKEKGKKKKYKANDSNASIHIDLYPCLSHHVLAFHDLTYACSAPLNRYSQLHLPRPHLPFPLPIQGIHPLRPFPILYQPAEFAGRRHKPQNPLIRLPLPRHMNIHMPNLRRTLHNTHQLTYPLIPDRATGNLPALDERLDDLDVFGEFAVVGLEMVREVCAPRYTELMRGKPVEGGESELGGEQGEYEAVLGVGESRRGSGEGGRRRRGRRERGKGVVIGGGVGPAEGAGKFAVLIGGGRGFGEAWATMDVVDCLRGVFGRDEGLGACGR